LCGKIAAACPLHPFAALMLVKWSRRPPAQTTTTARRGDSHASEALTCVFDESGLAPAPGDDLFGPGVRPLRRPSPETASDLFPRIWSDRVAAQGCFPHFRRSHEGDGRVASRGLRSEMGTPVMAISRGSRNSARRG